MRSLVSVHGCAILACVQIFEENVNFTEDFLYAGKKFGIKEFF